MKKYVISCTYSEVNIQYVPVHRFLADDPVQYIKENIYNINNWINMKKSQIESARHIYTGFVVKKYMLDKNNNPVLVINVELTNILKDIIDQYKDLM
jgi:hypothetical protein